MASTRDSELTRQHILDVTAQEMRVNGYKASSLSDILQQAGVSKGALYHHFANKQELGYAVFDEVFVQEYIDDWEVPLSKEFPIDAICDWFVQFAENVSAIELEVGYPACNIATEMCGIDEGFRNKTVSMFEKLHERLGEAFLQAQADGQLSENIDARASTIFIVASLQGAVMQGKYCRNVDMFKSTIKCLVSYIESLKA